jgi:hypothetical protein
LTRFSFVVTHQELLLGPVGTLYPGSSVIGHFQLSGREEKISISHTVNVFLAPRKVHRLHPSNLLLREGWPDSSGSSSSQASTGSHQSGALLESHRCRQLTSQLGPGNAGEGLGRHVELW